MGLMACSVESTMMWLWPLLIEFRPRKNTNSVRVEEKMEKNRRLIAILIQT